MMTLPEELVLLAIQTRQLGCRSYYLRYGIAGAVVRELILRNRLAVSDARLIAVDTTPTDDGVLDQALQMISDSTRQRKVKYWVNKLGYRLGAKGALLNSFVWRNVLSRKDDKVLGIFPRTTYELTNPSAGEEIVTRLRAVARDGVHSSDRTLALLSLASASRLTNSIVAGRDERRNLKEFAKGDPVGKAVADAITDMEAVSVVIAATSG